MPPPPSIVLPGSRLRNRLERRCPIRHSIDASLNKEADVDEPTTDRTLSDDDIETISPPVGSASTERPQDADGTDTHDMKDADGTDTRDTDGTDSRDTDGTDQPS